MICKKDSDLEIVFIPNCTEQVQGTKKQIERKQQFVRNKINALAFISKASKTNMLCLLFQREECYSLNSHKPLSHKS